MKKLNNKGFSLVELIIVIAIMAVLIGVLAPQFLRYVERSRAQKDRTAVGEVENAIEISLANEAIATAVNTAIAAGTAVTVNIDNTGAVTGTVADLTNDVILTTSADLDFTSNTFTTAGIAIVCTVTGTPTTGFTITTTGLPIIP